MVVHKASSFKFFKRKCCILKPLRDVHSFLCQNGICRKFAIVSDFSGFTKHSHADKNQAHRPSSTILFPSLP